MLDLGGDGFKKNVSDHKELRKMVWNWCSKITWDITWSINIWENIINKGCGKRNLTKRYNEFINLSSDQNNNSENIVNCKYYDIDEIQTPIKLNNKHTLSLFHINSYSLSKNIKILNTS